MQLTPAYGDPPVLALDGDPSAIAEPTIRQRRRLAAALATFTDEEWAHPSRCEGWSNRDVIVHLNGTNPFWSMTISEGLRGNPTRFLATFDPAATPAQMVASVGDISNAEVLDRFTTSTEQLAEVLTAISPTDWTALAEAPPGHISISAVAHHALWDSWVHERDVLLPLRGAAVEESDEVAACLRYVAGLGPAIGLTRGATNVGTLTIRATDPDLALTVDVASSVFVRSDASDSSPPATLELTGDAVELIESLSIRAPLPQQVSPDAAWLLQGLTDIFEAP